MALIRALTASSGGGGEKPTLLWSDNDGTNSSISVDHSAYQYILIISGYYNDPNAIYKKVTLCDKSVSSHHSIGPCAWSNAGYTYITVSFSSGTISIAYKESARNRVYAVYGCNSLCIDYTDIWARGDIA